MSHQRRWSPPLSQRSETMRLLKRKLGFERLEKRELLSVIISLPAAYVNSLASGVPIAPCIPTSTSPSPTSVYTADNNSENSGITKSIDGGDNLTITDGTTIPNGSSLIVGAGSTFIFDPSQTTNVASPNFANPAPSIATPTFTFAVAQGDSSGQWGTMAGAAPWQGATGSITASWDANYASNNYLDRYSNITTPAVSEDVFLPGGCAPTITHTVTQNFQNAEGNPLVGSNIIKGPETSQILPFPYGGNAVKLLSPAVKSTDSAGSTTVSINDTDPNAVGSVWNVTVQVTMNSSIVLGGTLSGTLATVQSLGKGGATNTNLLKTQSNTAGSKTSVVTKTITVTIPASGSVPILSVWKSILIARANTVTCETTLQITNVTYVSGGTSASPLMSWWNKRSTAATVLE